MNSVGILLLIGSVLAMVLAASYTDLSHRRIPNTITLMGATCGVLIHAVAGGLSGIMFALGGLAVGIACLLPGYILGHTGAGDAKLLGAVGAFLGPESTLVAAVAGIIAGALLALVVMLVAAGDRPWTRYGAILKHIRVTGRWIYLPPVEGELATAKFPFAPAIAVGALVGLWHYLERMS